MFEAGAKAVGYTEVSTGRMAINSIDNDERPACQQTGFCFQGCKWGAKWSAAYTDIPKGEATGNLEVRDHAHVARILHNDQGRVTGVEYFDKDGALQFQAARIVAVAGNSFESPRLLLNSASEMFPDGLANSSGQVGRNYMRHTTGSVYGIFENPCACGGARPWPASCRTRRATIPPAASSADTSWRPCPGLALHGGLPGSRPVGREFTTALDQYEYMAGLWIVGEDMPQETNRVTLSDTVDKFGLKVANVNFSDHPNDVAMRNHAYERGQAMYRAMGPRGPCRRLLSVHAQPWDQPHVRAAGGRRGQQMGQTHDIANLFVSDGSQFTTGAAENPTLTIVALAIRQADHIAKEMAAGTI
ncbi:GMC family oxidoreductase N-terminal domain-containing protein [Paracoccus marcusii]|nr:GMC family oxidoreductase N-terminal domain-containing protein [Paracoccus marcusii]